jgi:hypothetical protein
MPHKKSKEGFISVTEALNIISKPGLYYWFAKNGWDECQRIKKESQDFGTLVHENIQRLFEGKQLNTSNEQVKQMTTTFWKDFVDEYEVTPLVLEPEEPWVSEEHKLQGTPDAIIKTNKGIYIADWKTSSQIDKVTVPLQLAAYWMLNPTKHTIVGGVVVRLDKKEDKIQIKWYEDIGQHWPYFKHCLELAHYAKGNGAIK